MHLTLCGLTGKPKNSVSNFFLHVYIIFWHQAVCLVCGDQCRGPDPHPGGDSQVMGKVRYHNCDLLLQSGLHSQQR